MALSIRQLAVAGVLVLITFLAYSSQFLFIQLEPGPLSNFENWSFNLQLVCLLLSYARCCLTDAGSITNVLPDNIDIARQCRKCLKVKPPRAHHCKTCGHCILRMDHHCPWTANCVGLRTFPSFVRFLFYCVTAMAQLEYFIFVRLQSVWQQRHMPSYLGPSVSQLGHLFFLASVNSLTLFVLTILLFHTTWSLCTNTTSIEDLQIEKHEKNLARASARGGYLQGPEGLVRIDRHEFPYDIGILENICQGMGSSNPIAWFWPLSSSPSFARGFVYETNGFNAPHLNWPPPDPDRMYTRIERSDPFTYSSPNFEKDEVEQFRQRQARDLERWSTSNGLQARKKRHKIQDDDHDTSTYPTT